MSLEELGPPGARVVDLGSGNQTYPLTTEPCFQWQFYMMTSPWLSSGCERHFPVSSALRITAAAVGTVGIVSIPVALSPSSSVILCKPPLHSHVVDADLLPCWVPVVCCNAFKSGNFSVDHSCYRTLKLLV